MNPGEAGAVPLTKSELARELNAQIRDIAAELAQPEDFSEEFTFFCECSCLRPIKLTLSAFDAAGGAVIEGHSRPAS